jgi:hypothetical protein
VRAIAVAHDGAQSSVYIYSLVLRLRCWTCVAPATWRKFVQPRVNKTTPSKRYESKLYTRSAHCCKRATTNRADLKFLVFSVVLAPICAVAGITSGPTYLACIAEPRVQPWQYRAAFHSMKRSWQAPRSHVTRVTHRLSSNHA